MDALHTKHYTSKRHWAIALWTDLLIWQRSVASRRVDSSVNRVLLNINQFDILTSFPDKKNLLAVFKGVA